ncbi:MAG: hypothetical protein MUC60_12110 [Oscillatoria sp. Prado101]|nr:hypothetical protein [Oscillatoria sp. Prado101]
MDIKEVKQVASQLLAGLLANPHVYPNYSDDGVRGEREQILINLAIEMASELIEKVDKRGR